MCKSTINRMEKRENWVDQARGFAMFLVVYGHNFPVTEKYIYSFHMPLFLIISGFFFPEKPAYTFLQKKFRTIIVPYFFWAIFLFVFWIILGKNFGDSATKNLSITKNFIGIFFSQGGQEYMDWGIPMWFLPNLFLAFLFLFFCKLYFKKKWFFAVLVLTFLGILYPKLSDIPLFWSINIALVSLFFVAIGKQIYITINKTSKKKRIFWMIIFFIINVLLFQYKANVKVDMYQSIYGNEILFFANGFFGSLAFLLLFKNFPYFRFLEIIGKFTLVILALQILAMSLIKLFLWKVLHISNFQFSEFQKLYFSIIQIIILLPIGFIINQYIPLLNGGSKKI